MGRVAGPNSGDGTVPLCPPDARIALGDPRRTGLRLLRQNMDIGRSVLHGTKWRAWGGLREPRPNIGIGRPVLHGTKWRASGGFWEPRPNIAIGRPVLHGTKWRASGG